MLINFYSQDVKLLEILEKYTNKDVIKKIDDKQGLIEFKVDDQGNSLYIGNEHLDFHKTLYHINNTEKVYFVSTIQNSVFNKELVCVYSNRLIRQYEIPEYPRIVIIERQKYTFLNLLNEYKNITNKIVTLFNAKKINPAILNHIIEFELSTLNFMKYAICNPSETININIHDAEKWKMKLKYNDMNIETLTDYYINHNLFNQHFLMEKYKLNYIYIKNQKYYFADMVFNLVSHTLEHIEEMESNQ